MDVYVQTLAASPTRRSSAPRPRGCPRLRLRGGRGADRAQRGVTLDIIVAAGSARDHGTPAEAKPPSSCSSPRTTCAVQQRRQRIARRSPRNSRWPSTWWRWAMAHPTHEPAWGAGFGLRVAPSARRAHTFDPVVQYLAACHRRSLAVDAQPRSATAARSPPSSPAARARGGAPCPSDGALAGWEERRSLTTRCSSRVLTRSAPRQRSSPPRRAPAASATSNLALAPSGGADAAPRQWWGPRCEGGRA